MGKFNDHYYRPKQELLFKTATFYIFFDDLPIPLNIRNAPTPLMKELGYGKGYKRYPTEDLLPEKIKGKKYLEQRD